MSTAIQTTVTGEGYGYVYVMSYPGSDKVKIGHALNPTTRAADIGGTLAPETPILEAYFWCSERREAVERAAHLIEKDSRHNGEWFCISIERAMSAIKQAAASANVSITLAYERAGYEAKAAAERQAQLEFLSAMSDDRFEPHYAAIKSALFERCRDPKKYALTEWQQMIYGEYLKRQPRWQEETRVRAADALAVKQAKAQAEAQTKQAKKQAEEQTQAKKDVEHWENVQWCFVGAVVFALLYLFGIFATGMADGFRLLMAVSVVPGCGGPIAVCLRIWLKELNNMRKGA